MAGLSAASLLQNRTPFLRMICKKCGVVESNGGRYFLEVKCPYLLSHSDGSKLFSSSSLATCVPPFHVIKQASDNQLAATVRSPHTLRVCGSDSGLLEVSNPVGSDFIAMAMLGVITPWTPLAQHCDRILPTYLGMTNAPLPPTHSRALDKEMKNAL